MVVGSLATLSLVFALTFVQSVWIYESGTPTRAPHYSTAYNVSNISNIAGIIMRK
jgi:hypothetical protein